MTRSRVSVLVACALACLLGLAGCGRDAPPAEGVGPQGAGLIQRVEDIPAPGDEYTGRAVSPQPELTRLADGIKSRHDQLETAYSPDGTKALVYPRMTGVRGTQVWLATKGGERRIEVEMQGDVGLEVLWGPASRHVLLFSAIEQGEELSVACISSAESANGAARTGAGPSGSQWWNVGPFNTDGKLVFCMARGPEGQIWGLAVPACEFRLLYTQPPVQWPPGDQKMIDRYGPGVISYGRAEEWGHLLPSPSGRLLLFDSYPPDNYRAQALWVVDLETEQSRLVTWEGEERYDHFPWAWGQEEASFVFGRFTRDSAEDEYYKLTLDPGVPQPKPSPADE